MEKKTNKSRLQLLNGGRDHYLQFLRNLTPQILLLSMAFLIMGQLDFTKFDLNNWLQTALFFIMLGSVALAFYASSTIFYENCFSELINWRAELFVSLNTQNVRGFRRFLAKLRAIWNERFLELIELMVVFFFLHIALAIVLIMSIHTATRVWGDWH